MIKGIDAYCVYKHTCPNNKVYIGITCRNPLIRWRNGNGYKQNIHFYHVILKYGWDNIKHEILYSGLTKEEACQKETELITQYKSVDPNFGYNIAPGGETPWNTGKTLNEEIKKKMSLAAKGRPKSEEQRMTLRNLRKGTCLTEEQKQKIKESVTRTKGHPIIQMDKSGNVIATYPSIQMASAAIGKNKIQATVIRNAAAGIKKSAYGFIWKFKEDLI